MVRDGWTGIRGAVVALARKVIFGSFPLVDRIVPKNSKIVAFAQSRNRFSDNSRALFAHMQREGSQLSPVWIAITRQQQRKIKQIMPDAHVCLVSTLDGFWTALRARTVVISHGLTDFHPLRLTSGRKTVLMLWHATSFKKTSVVNAGWSERQIAYHLDHVARHITLMIASSGLDRLAKAASHGIDARRVLVTGLPRNDQLMRGGSPTGHPVLDRALAATTLLYAPTWRESGDATRFFPFADLDVEALNRFLADRDAYILIRPHQNDRASLAMIRDWGGRNLDRIVSATPDEVPDVADILPQVDVVVTDYSSIYLDLLLRDVPPVFVPYDREHYSEARGLLYDYEAITPGPKVRTQAQFVEALEEAMDGAEAYRPQRELVRTMFHEYCDANACRRVADALAAHLGLEPAAERVEAASPHRHLRQLRSS